MEFHDLKSALLLRILLVIPFTILIVKTCLYLIKNINKGQDQQVDFDELVKKKAEYLKFNMANQEVLERGINLSNTEKVYKDFFSLPQNQKNLEKERFFQVFGNIQWGESPFHFEVINYIKKYYFKNIDLIQVTKAINTIIKKDILISPKWRNLPSLADFEQIVSIKVIFDIFIDEASRWGGETLIAFCKKEEVELKDTCKAITYFFFSKEKSNIFLEIINNNPPQKSLISTFKTSELQNRIIERLLEQIQRGNDPRNFLKEISNLSILFDSLKKITPLNSKFDLDGARRIFNLNNMASVEEIKKRYKSLAKINHPDTLISFGLPDDLLKMVNENFRQIKSAYDLLIANQLSN